MTRWVPLAAVLVLLAAAMLAAAFANPSIEGLPQGPVRTGPAQVRPTLAPTLNQTGIPTLPAPSDGGAGPAWLGYVIAGLCAAIVLFVVGLLLWILLRDRLGNRPPPVLTEVTRAPVPTDVRTTVRAALDEGLADLDDRDADPRRAIIACWVRLEETAAAAGTSRLVGDTSTDLVGRMLAAHEISADVLASFAAVYREARFATHTIDPSMRDQARAALTQLRDELTTGVVTS